MSSGRGTLHQFMTFAGVGAVATAVQYVVLLVGVQLLKTDPVWSSSIGYIFSAMVNYVLNHRVTFRSRLAHRRAIPRFVVVVSSGLVLTALFMNIGVHRLQIHYLPVQLVTTGIVLVWNFIASRRWTFYDSGDIPD